MIKMCKCADIFFLWMVYELLCMHHLSLFLSFWIRGYLFFFDMPKHVAYLLWVCIFYSLFFDMPKHVANLLWVCIILFSFCIAPHPWYIFLRERCHTWTWSFILWVDGYLLTSSVEALHVVETCTWSWSWEYEMNLTKGRNNLTKLNEIASCICGKFCNENNICLWIGISYHWETLLYFCVFKI